jgi:hypothetical protein
MKVTPRPTPVIAVVLWGVGIAIAHAQSPPAVTNEGGYTVTRSQTVANVPAGSVGRKTTDTETRVGNTKETEGLSRTTVMTIGGFARSCPTAEGIVAGTFEYLLTVDEVKGASGATERTHYVRSLLATLTGHVRDDGTIEYVEVDAEFTRGVDGTQKDRVRTRFTPGADGSLDMRAMQSAVEQTADITIAIVIAMAGPVYTQAQLEWSKLNRCVEFSFDPPTGTRAIGPNESADVRTELRTKDGGVRVARTPFEAGPLGGVGTVAPRKGETPADAPVVITYTATATPKRGNGIDIAAKSRAGFAGGKWEIAELVKFEGTFSQTEATSMSGVYGINVTGRQKVTGRLVWTPEQNSLRARTFGEVPSQFYVATEGEITAAIDNNNRSRAGSCAQEGSKTFAIKDLPPVARQYLVLEVAADGRYRMMLGMVSAFLQFEARQRCSSPMGRVPGGNTNVNVNSVGIVIGQQDGRVTDEGVVGQTAQPIMYGPLSYTGEWRFKKTQ